MDQNALHFLTFATIGWLYLQGSIIRIYPTTLTTANPLCTPRNLVTGSKIRVIGGGFLESFTFYDDRYRVVKTIEENHLGGKETISTEYYNAVSPLVSKTTRDHSGPTAKEIIEEYTYDHMDRVKTIKTTIGSDISTITNTYNEIGELITKDLSGAQTVDYEYNIRGWLRKINGGTSFSGNDRFGMELKYNNAPNAQYNGNIGQMLWKSIDNSSDTYDSDQGYTFEYDGLSRLKKAVYTGSGANYFSVGGDDNGKIRYDLNGNIASLSRNQHVKFYSSTGAVSWSSRQIDNISYNYLTGNQLNEVADLSTDTEIIDKRAGKPDDTVKDLGFTDGADEVNEYVYDANGNMMRDLNKDVININYNFLNLPELVKFGDGKEVTYTYDATGKKLKMEVSTGNTTHYVNGIHYTGTAIQFVQVPEGRYSFVTSAYEYDLKDHLGNVRVTVDKDGIVQQRDDYYPFGGTFNSYTSGTKNNYLYQSKEEQEELDTYDFHARMYDPMLGRTWQIDPMSDLFYDHSPYSWVKNNPLLRIDPTGMTDFTFDKKSGEVSQVGEANDEPDRILRTNRKGEVKYKKNGEAKVAMGGIEQGILADGQNWKTDDQVIEVGGEGQPTANGVESFTLGLSEYIGKELSGYSYSSDGSGDVTDMLIGNYENNSRTESSSSPADLVRKYRDSYSHDNIQGAFHTHPDGKLGATQSAPHQSADVQNLQRDKPSLPNASFYILYRVQGQSKPGKYDYTHEYRAPRKKK